MTQTIDLSVTLLERATAIARLKAHKLSLDWFKEVPISSLRESAETLSGRCITLQHCDPEMFSGSAAPFEEAQIATGSFAEHLRKTTYALEGEMAQLKSELEQNQATLESLRKNIKDYPTGLLDLKNQLQTQLFKREESEFLWKFWPIYWKSPMAKKHGAARWKAI